MNTGQKPDFNALAEKWTNDGTWGYPNVWDEAGEFMFREIKKAFAAGHESCWDDLYEKEKRRLEQTEEISKVSWNPPKSQSK
jgi:hypothetical protein